MKTAAANSFNGLTLSEGCLKGSFKYQSERGWNTSACFPLTLIRMAWDAGCPFEEEADGYGPGVGTMGDWSGIRDSSHEATEKMTEKALNFISRKLGG